MSVCEENVQYINHIGQYLERSWRLSKPSSRLMGNCGCLRRNDKEFDEPIDKPILQPQPTPVSNPQECNPQSFHSVPQRLKVKETINLKKSNTQEGEKKLNDYTLKHVLGQGSFGKVRLAEKNLQSYAIKILNKNRLKKQREYYTDCDGVVKIKNAFENVTKEIAVMKKLRHPNIIRLFEIIDSPNSHKMYLVMEYAQNGQLIDWDENNEQFIFTQDRQKLEENELRQICKDIIKGVYQMHKLGIVHRDLKPQNILFDSNNRAKICDFGVAQIINGDSEHQGTNGTYVFMAPECFESAQYDRKAADIWALGISIYAFAFLTVPFKGQMTEIMEAIQTQEIQYPEANPDFIAFLKKCLDKNPKTRSTIKDLAQDYWINKQGDLLQEIKEQLVKVEINQNDIQEAYSLATFILIKNWAAKMKHQ